MRILVSILAIVLGCHACAARTVPSLSDEQRGRLGRLGVAVVDTTPKSKIAGPTPLGGVGGGALGAAQGMTIGVLSGVGCFATLGYAWPLCISAAMTPYWVGRGSVEGALNALPEGERRRSQAAIVAAIAAVDPQRIARGIEEEARRRSRSVAFVSPGAPGIGTVAEVTLLRLVLEERPSASSSSVWSLSVPDVNPMLGVLAEARLRVVSTADDTVLLERTYVRRSTRDTKFADWARDDAAEFERARDQALDDLANDVALELFGVAPVTPVEPPPPGSDPGID